MTTQENSQEVFRELQEIAPGLAELNKGEGFTVPHTYFKDLPDRLINSISTAPSPTPTPSWLYWLQQWTTPRMVVVYASVLFVAIAAAWVFQPAETTSDPLAAVTEEEAIQYVLSNISDFSGNDLLESGITDTYYADVLTPQSDDAVDAYLDNILNSGDDQIYEEILN